MKTTNFILFLLFPIISFSQSFNLTGNFKGNHTEKIVLGYYNANGNFVQDTLKIKNGKFQYAGKLDGVQRVRIIGDMKSNSMEDPNLGYFFLEPGNTEIILKENNFKNIIVKESKSQEEYRLVENETNPIHLKLDSISKNRTENSAELLRAGQEKIQKIELCYAIENPKSSLSPYFLDNYKRSIPLDSVKTIFNSFSIENRNSSYGKNINELLEKNIVKTNDMAPDFAVKDISGNILSLDSFKGKYLLIDFWADWCKPCIAKLPEVKSLINKYDNKDLKVLFVSFDETEDKWKEGIKKYNIGKWEHSFVGKKYSAKESISYKFDIQPIPAYILIDPQGKIIGRYGNASKEGKSFIDLENKLKAVIK